MDHLNRNRNMMEWNKALLIILAKKGDLTDPNNCRGICLQDAVGNMFIILSTTRQFSALKEIGTEEQLGCHPGQGTQAGSFCLKSSLQL
mmetsp:Transcript_50272/g.151353  ORF Transcript_50272/g.151353 Transcript_50272/m.151353 type:complete len:89 (+) Transcript_50272:170-436(+)